MAPRNVQPSKGFLETLRRYEADRAVSSNCGRFIEGSAHPDNPASAGAPGKGKPAVVLAHALQNPPCLLAPSTMQPTGPM